MDEEKSCCDEERDEEIRPDNGLTLGNAAPGALRYATDYRGDRPTAINECDEEPVRDGGNRIQDLVIKQADLGYLVKVGCQTLCIETKERLIELFTAYVKNPDTTMNRHYAKTLLSDDKNVVHIGVVGSSLDDIREFLQHSAILPFKEFRKTKNRYEGEINGEIFILIPLTRP